MTTIEESNPQSTSVAVQLQHVTPLRMIVIGAGQRGKVYAQYALERPDLCKVVAVAEPRAITRERMGDQHGVPSEHRFADWKDVVKAHDELIAAGKGRLADAAVVTTQDRMHCEPTIEFANRGYQILLEKPMAVCEDECKAITKAVVDNKVILAVGHVMRYTPYSRKIKQIIDDGGIGDLISMQHLEPVGFDHFAHSYVRGNWSKEETASFMLMAKSCHDIDWICWMMGKSKCLSTYSIGSLAHFRKENKPTAGAAKRCTECPTEVERKCPYSAIRIYNEAERGKSWAMTFLEEDTPEALSEALTTGPYGRCVYEHDNTVVDNQAVLLKFEDNKTADFSVVAFTKEICVRKTRIFGSHGQIEGDGETVIHHDFRTGKTEKYAPNAMERPNTKLTGHHCADYFFMKSFVEAAVAKDPSKILSGPGETLSSHLVVFAAEKARRENRPIDMDW